MKSGVPGFVGIRLKQAREAVGLSITSLADLIGVSKQAVSQYEKGSDSPSPLIFDRIRTVLGHDYQFFLRPPVNSLIKSTCFYRSMAAATKTARTKAEMRQLWVRELVCYLSEHIELPHAKFPDFCLPSDPTRIGMSEIEILASDLRSFWKLGSGPIANLVNVAELNGALIVRHSMDAETLDGLSEWLQPEGLPLVILNTDKNIAVRSRLDLAHELGHLVLHQSISPEQLRRSEIFDLLEAQAFRFGSALLLPEHSFLEDLYSASLDALRTLKPKWKVSIAMMIERLKHLNIITDEQHRRLRINYSTRRWNRQEPLDSEIPIEQPVFLSKAFKLLIDNKIQTPEQIISASGFGPEWIHRLLNLPVNLFDPKQPEVKVLEFRRRA